jgi:hypothetical protein
VTDSDAQFDADAVLDVVCLIIEEHLEQGGVIDEDGFEELRHAGLTGCSVDEGLALFEITYDQVCERLIDRAIERQQLAERQRDHAANVWPSAAWPNPPGVRRRRVMIGHRQGWVIEPDKSDPRDAA